jgi:hypothetical protein
VIATAQWPPERDPSGPRGCRCRRDARPLGQDRRCAGNARPPDEEVAQSGAQRPARGGSGGRRCGEGQRSAVRLCVQNTCGGEIGIR